MDIKQDPNSIPNFNAGGRLGELQPNQPEQAQSSVELDPDAGGDGAASGELATEGGHRAPLEERRGVRARPDQVTGAGAGPTATDTDRPPADADRSRTGGGAIDGLVGAP